MVFNYEITKILRGKGVSELDDNNKMLEYAKDLRKKPFIILRKENSYIKVSVIFENVKAINPIIS